MANLPTGFHVSIRCHGIGRTFVLAPPTERSSEGMASPVHKYRQFEVDALVIEALDWFKHETGGRNV